MAFFSFITLSFDEHRHLKYKGISNIKGGSHYYACFFGRKIGSVCPVFHKIGGVVLGCWDRPYPRHGIRDGRAVRGP